MINCWRNIAFSISKSVRLRIKSVVIPDTKEKLVGRAQWLSLW
jgi:hypothetical protein